MVPNPPTFTLRRKLITDAVVTQAKTLPNVQVFRGEIDDPVATLPNSSRVNRYIVIYPFGGDPGPDRELSDTAIDLDYGFQATVVAGYATDAEYLIDQTYALFYRWIPAVTGLVFGSFRPPTGYDPGPMRRDDDVQPPRFWSPLQFVTTATAT